MLPEIKISMEPAIAKYRALKFVTPEEAAKILRENCFPADEICYRERFVVLCATRQNSVIGFSTIGIGGRSSTVADVVQIMQAAIKSNASTIVVAHNHPSGNLKPSPADERLTNSIKQACEILDINLADHIILTEEDFYSFRNEGKL